MARPKKQIQAPTKTTCVVYARVSTKEQSDEGYSIDAQLALLRSYALRHDFSVAGEFVESETAKVSGRHAFSAMLTQVKNDGITAILVEKTDRLYRNLKDYVRVDELDIEVHLVKEGEVISRNSSSHGKFIHGIKLLMAKNYSDNLSEEARKGMLEKARQGIWPTKAPLGYLNVAVGSRRVIAIDPERAETVSRLFGIYADGETSLQELARTAFGMGLRSRMGRKVARSELHKILQNSVYCGVIKWGGETHQGIHEPLIDQATFEKAQAVMSGRNITQAKPSSALEFVYKGLFTCARCGCAISAQRTKGHAYYACTGARGCTRQTVREEVITNAIAEKLEGITVKPEVLSLLRQALVESLNEEKALRADELPALEAERADLRHKLERLYLDKGAVKEWFLNAWNLRFLPVLVASCGLCNSSSPCDRLQGSSSTSSASHWLRSIHGSAG